MRIDRLTIYQVRLPLKETFAISRLRRSFSRCVVVEAIAAGGRFRGYGEGLPVTFVTGETPGTVTDSLRAFAVRPDFPWQLDSVAAVSRFVRALPAGREHNAAMCALECALLDLQGKREQRSVVDFFPARHRVDRVRYGAPLMVAEEPTLLRHARRIREMGIRCLRIKMDRRIGGNRTALEVVKRVFGAECHLRADPNGVWDPQLALAHLPLLAEHGVQIIEEPLGPGDPALAELSAQTRRMGMDLMACESAPTLAAVERIVAGGLHAAVNVKLCRSGGFLRSLAIIDRLRNAGLRFQIGCTLGESGLLSAAGRTLGLLCGDAFTCDGAYDRFLLAQNLTTRDVDFGRGGVAGPLPGPGLGVEVDRRRLARLAIDQFIIRGPGRPAHEEAQR